MRISDWSSDVCSSDLVNVEAWRADHATADMPHLPSSELTISTTRIELPDDVPGDTIAASDWKLRPDHPHWPLVWLPVLTQLAAGGSSTPTEAGDRHPPAPHQAARR